MSGLAQRPGNNRKISIVLRPFSQPSNRLRDCRTPNFLLAKAGVNIDNCYMEKQVMLANRISTDSNICHGQACIRGTRIPVHQIVGMLANGDTFESLLIAYPTITKEDISACLEYAAWLAEEQVTPLGEVVGSV